ncbi:hypothetical protein, partial [Mesorhizobium sp.]|uniref:hypothetical protein n=1 Tax=Mesorhizobium sp. TaxID=1871066 RepID=UPI0025D71E14
MLLDVTRRELCCSSPRFVGIAPVSQVSIADRFVAVQIQDRKFHPANKSSVKKAIFASTVKMIYVG